MFKCQSAVLLLMIISSLSCGGGREPGEVAKFAVGDYRNLINEQNYRKLGFHSFDEIERMELGIPMPLHRVALQDISEYSRGGDTSRFLREPVEMLYPVRVNGQLRCSVSLKKKNAQWKAWSFGRPVMSAMLAGIRDRQASATQRSVEDFFGVEVPGLYLLFLGSYDGEDLMLTHVHDDDEFGLESGKTEAASDLIPRIAATAKEYVNPLP